MTTCITAGSESRGLFRPWRLAESPYLISQALGKFLDLVLPDGAPGILDAFHPFSGIETEGLEKEAILKLIFDEIGPHNAAACLKWVRQFRRTDPQTDTSFPQRAYGTPYSRNLGR